MFSPVRVHARRMRTQSPCLFFIFLFPEFPEFFLEFPCTCTSRGFSPEFLGESLFLLRRAAHACTHASTIPWTMESLGARSFGPKVCGEKVCGGESFWGKSFWGKVSGEKFLGDSFRNLCFSTARCACTHAGSLCGGTVPWTMVC